MSFVLRFFQLFQVLTVVGFLIQGFLVQGFLILGFTVLTSCSLSHEDASSEETPIPPLTASQLRELAQNDHDQLSQVSFQDNWQVESQVRLSTEKFFGGLRGKDFLKFLDVRIHYFLTEDEKRNMTSDAFQGQIFGTDPSSQSKFQIVAQNLGGVLWATAAAFRFPNASVNFRGTNVSIQDPRSGLMLLGPGYQLYENQLAGQAKIKIPSASRQATLLHEARHSDCTGGLLPGDIERFQGVRAKEIHSPENINCLHRHVVCPIGHDFEGELACDSEPWGAYTAGLLFSAMSVHNMQGDDQAYMQMVVADQLDRLLFETDKMLTGELGEPDLSSTPGVIK